MNTVLILNALKYLIPALIIIVLVIKFSIDNAKRAKYIKETRQRNTETLEIRAAEKLKARGIDTESENYQLLLQEEIKSLKLSDTWVNQASHYYTERMNKKNKNRAAYWGVDPSALLNHRDPELKQQIKKFNRKFFGEITPVKKNIAEQKKLNYDLPEINTEIELAEFLGISLSKLRWFSFNKETEKFYHYTIFKQPKRNGKFRNIMAPKKDLKRIQRKILQDILEKVPSQTDVSHGFIKNKSIITNASKHVNQKVVINIDLKDFFETVTFPRVRGLFISLGYNYAISNVLALLTTEFVREEVNIDDEKYFVSINKRALPQGAPTSPMISNMVAYKLDKRLLGLAAKNDFNYTRYADDLTFSGNDLNKISKLLNIINLIVKEEGFNINKDKTRILRSSRRQEVTGVVVNEKINVSRKTRRQLRAIIHNIGKSSLESQNRSKRKNFDAYIKGMIAFVGMSNKSASLKLKQSYNKCLARHT